jgi:CxxC motif-containing protein (DUF1111 family)
MHASFQMRWVGCVIECTLALLAGCGGTAGGDALDQVEEGEMLPGGATTNRLLFGGNAFLQPADNLQPEHEQQFYSGNSFFNQAWVEAPASTAARDGLGPLFNARSCSGCHFRDGKASLPEDGQGPFVGLLLRLSVPGEEGPEPDPVYGGQLQDQALPRMDAEAVARIAWDEMDGEYADGTPYTLLSPSYRIESPAYGPLPDDLMVSPRLAPHMIGLGLLEAIPVERLQQLADPDDEDADGISGRLQWHRREGERVVGRFGWKGDAPSVDVQVAGAFAGDMGLTTPLMDHDDCTEAEAPCLQRESGGAPEVEPHIFERVVLYSRTVAVPARRRADDPQVLAGKRLFHEIGCADCHVPSHETGEAALPELEGQRIWPYTDLLLHDMGEALADGRPLGEASGREWRTPPLWGLGLIEAVGDHTRFLHDGRARGFAEAILWHGGEAEAAREAFRTLDAQAREDLIAFLEDL